MKELFDIDNWLEIDASLMRNKTRSFLTGFGIFWGVFMLVVLWAGGNGLEQMMRDNFKGFSTNCAVFWPNVTGENYMGFTKGRSWYFNRRDMESLLANVSGVESVEPQLTQQAKVAYGDKSMDVSVLSNCPGTYSLQTPKVLSGRVVNQIDINRKLKVVVLGNKLAETLFNGVEPVGKYVTIDGVGYQVVGVMKCLSEGATMSIDENAVHMPLTTMQTAFNRIDRFWNFTIGFKPGYKVSSELSEIRKYLFRNHSISPTDTKALEMFDISAMFESVNLLLLSIKVLAFIVGAGSLMAGIIGVGNIMMIIIKERTPEIGIRRALGAKPSDIVKQILLESIVLTLLAGLSGLSVAVGVMALVSKTSETNFSISFVEGVVILVLFIILGMLAGVLPARRAMHIKPIEAMHDR